MPYNPSEIMHMKELESWVQPYAELSGQSREQVIGDIINIWQDEGKLIDSGELAVKLTEKYLDQKDVSEAAKQQILADVRDAEAIKRSADGTTGVLKKDHKGVETALSHIYAKETGKPVMMLEFDFGNMGGTNEHFQKKYAIEKFQQDHGHATFADAEKAFKALPLEEQKVLSDAINIKQTFSKTDIAAKIITQSVYSDLQAHFPDSQVTAIRTGGDELRFIVEGVEPSKYNDIIMATTHNVEIKMAELGLLDHEHAKGRNNRFKDGFGGGLAAKDMREINDPDNIIAQMDEDVKAHKDSIGEVRVGRHINIEETVKRNFGLAKDADISALPAAEQQRFNEEVKRQGEYLEKNAANIRAHAPKPAATIADYDEKAAKILAEVDRTPQNTVNDPNLKAADVDGLAYDQYATIEERRAAYMEQKRVPEYEKANGGPLDESIKKFMDHEVRSINPMDPSAGVHTVSDFYQNAKLWHEAAGDGPKPSTMFVGFQNLGGLNNLLGHDGADAVLTDMAKIVKTSLNEAGIESDKFVIAHNGGGEFRLLVQPGYEDQLTLAQQTIADKTADLNRGNISEYLEKKGINLDADTKEKIAGKSFSVVEDPKVRETAINGQKIEGYADGLAVISTHSEIEIAPHGTPDKSWDMDHVLTDQKKHLDAATDQFRHEEILHYQGINENNPPDPNKEYKATREAAAKPEVKNIQPEFTKVVEQGIESNAELANKADSALKISDEAAELSVDAARGLIKAGKLAKLSVVGGIALTGGVGALINYVHENQREDAKDMLDKGDISQEAYDDYMKLSENVENMMQAENIGGQGFFFVVTTPLVEIEAQRKFEEFANRHSDIPQHLLEKLNVSMLDTQTQRGAFNDVILKNLPNDPSAVSPELHDLIEAKNDMDSIHNRYKQMLRVENRNGRIDNDLIQEAKEKSAEAKQGYETKLIEKLGDPQTAREILNMLPEDDKLDMALTIAKFDKSVGTEFPQIARINELQEKIDNIKGAGRGVSERKAPYEKELRALSNELENNPELVDQFLISHMEQDDDSTMEADHNNEGVNPQRDFTAIVQQTNDTPKIDDNNNQNRAPSSSVQNLGL